MRAVFVSGICSLMVISTGGVYYCNSRVMGSYSLCYGATTRTYANSFTINRLAREYVVGCAKWT
ncbi:MAG: hypothetical protein ACTSWN_10420 [Promethearchaeota archaeon]